MQKYGRVAFDLASSGIPTVAQAELGASPSLDAPDGWERLKAAIAHHHATMPEEVTAALGASHGLWLAWSALVGPGDEVLVEDPSYEPIVLGADAAGASVRRFDRGPDVGYALDPGRVEAALSAKTRVVAISNLHNPSGVRASDDAMREVAKMLAARGGHLFVDEVYSPFEGFVDDAGVFHGSARRLAPNVVTTSSLTKAYGLGPQRVGWVLGPRDVIERAEDAVVASMGVLPLPWMFRAILGLSRVSALAERTRGLLADKRRRVAAWMDRHPELAWSAPSGGLFGFAMHRDRDLDLRPVIERGIDAHGVIVAPGSFFGIPSGFRLAWSLPETNLDEALDRLDRSLRG